VVPRNSGQEKFHGAQDGSQPGCTRPGKQRAEEQRKPLLVGGQYTARRDPKLLTYLASVGERDESISLIA